MRRAGRVVAEMLDACRRAAEPGVSTAELDQVARRVLDRRGAKSNFLNYGGFPAVICTSPNDVVVHGIPGSYRLAEGDILSIDCGAVVDGYHGDAAITFPIGEVDDELVKLMDTTRASLAAGIERFREGGRLTDIGEAVQSVAEAQGFSVVTEYVGHGIGTALHEDPSVANYGPGGRGMRLKVGHVLAIEPMVNIGGAQTRVHSDGWTVLTADGRPSAHFEHSVALTEDGPLVLTSLDG